MLNTLTNGEIKKQPGMQSIIIPSKINNNVIEELLLKVNHSSADIDLEVPVELNYRGFGMVPSLLLIVFSWMRKSKGKLIVPISPDDHETIEQFTTDYFGYTLLSTLWKSKEIINNEGVSLKEVFRKYTLKMHDRIDFFQDLPNESILIPCFDHYSKSKGLSHWLYINDFEYAESPSALHNTVYRIFEYLGKNYKTRINANTAKSFDDLQTIIWELLRNTDDHAKKDYLNQSSLSPNTRGIFFRIHRSSKANFIDYSGHHPGLEKYYNSVLDELKNFILEISVFDSGPGMVKRFLGPEWTDKESMSEEVDVIKKCLIKGNTSVKDYQGQLKGFGLDNVLSTLNRHKGFLKIRSNHVSLYRDLSETPYVETKDIAKVELKDWNTGSASEFTKLSSTEGTLITMAYPINEL